MIYPMNCGAAAACSARLRPASPSLPEAGLPAVAAKQRRLVPVEGVKRMRPLNSLSCPTPARCPIEFQCLFLTLSHRTKLFEEHTRLMKSPRDCIPVAVLLDNCRLRGFTMAIQQPAMLI